MTENHSTWHFIGGKEYEHDGIRYTGRYREQGESVLKRTFCMPDPKESKPAQEWLRLANKAGNELARPSSPRPRTPTHRCSRGLLFFKTTP